MISELSVYTKPTNNKARVSFWTLLGASAVNVAAYLIMSYMQVQKAGLVGVMSLVFITAAVLIYTKYLSPRYYYDITHDSQGVAVFVVRQVNGKRESTFCRISLHDIMSAQRETPAERRAHKTPFGYRKYVYVPTLMPDVTYRLTVRNRYEQAEIVIEASDEFVTYLTGCVAEAKAIEAERDAQEPW